MPAGIAGGGWIRDPQLPTRPGGGCRWHSASSVPSSTWSSTTQPPRQSRSHGERHELGIRSRALQLLVLGGPHRRGRRHVRHTGAPLFPPACLRPLLPVRDSRVRPPVCLRPGSPDHRGPRVGVRLRQQPSPECGFRMRSRGPGLLREVRQQVNLSGIGMVPRSRGAPRDRSGSGFVESKPMLANGQASLEQRTEAGGFRVRGYHPLRPSFRDL